MTDISKSTSQASKRRLHEIDETIEKVSKTLEKLSSVHKFELECSLLTAKLKREKLNALAAAANSQVILSEMDILIAETDLYTDLLRLKKSKKLKLDQDENTPPRSLRQSTPVPIKKSNSMTSQDEHIKNTRKNKKKSKNCDPSSDETVIVGELRDKESILGSSQSVFSSALSSKCNVTSDSDASISSSVLAEFNNPYSTASRLTPDKKPTNTHDTAQTQDMKPKMNKASVEKSSNNIRLSKQQNPLPKITKVGSESTHTNKNNCGASNSLKRKLEADNSSVPIRHNLPKVITKPKCTADLTQTITNSKSQTHYDQILSSRANVYQSSMSFDSQGIGPSYGKLHKIDL